MEEYRVALLLRKVTHTEAPFRQGRLQVKTTKYLIGSAFRLDGDGVFGA